MVHKTQTKENVQKQNTSVDQTKAKAAFSRDNVPGNNSSAIAFLIPGMSDRHSVGRSP